MTLYQLHAVDTSEVKPKPLGGHESTRMKNDEWLTPPHILKALGSFDLDPCAPVVRPWNMAAEHFTVRENGLLKTWFGRVWLNPPFGNQAIKWLRRLVAHGDGIALLPARTETRMFYEAVWNIADAVLFIKGRPSFHYVSGAKAIFSTGAPICLIAYGQDNVDSLLKSRLGVVVKVCD